ncbi:MAG: hypothetical protein ABIS14_12760 [Sphingomonas sp.]
MIIAAAALAYLSCTIPTKHDPELLMIAADEANQIATITWPRWKITSREPATFAADWLSINSGFSTYRINRSTLVLERDTRMAGAKPKNEVGVCTVSPAPADRKF